MPRELSVPVAGPEPPRSLSPTSASTWRQCELKFALTYLAGWQEPSTMPQLVGNVVHRAVELLYGTDPAARNRSAASDLLRVALAEELSKPTYETLLATGDPTGAVVQSGEDSLDGLFALEDPSRITVDVAGLEIWVRAELYGTPIRGRIDRLYDAQGAEVIADYKTGKVPKPIYTAKAFFGLWTYVAGLAASDPDHRLADRVELLYLAGRERLSRPVLRDVALEHARQLAAIWREILLAVERRVFVARRSRLCDWCAFQSACPIFQWVPAVGSAEHDGLLTASGLTRRQRTQVADSTERQQDAAEAEGATP